MGVIVWQRNISIVEFSWPCTLCSMCVYCFLKIIMMLWFWFLYHNMISDFAWRCENYGTADWLGFLHANCSWWIQKGFKLFGSLQYDLSCLVSILRLTHVAGMPCFQWYAPFAFNPCSMQFTSINRVHINTMARYCSCIACAPQGTSSFPPYVLDTRFRNIFLLVSICWIF